MLSGWILLRETGKKKKKKMAEAQRYDACAFQYKSVLCLLRV